MTVQFELPSLGEGVESADVAEILVGEGDVVKADQPILELETEKAVMEVPCPHAGTISRVHVSEGETIRVGQVLLTIETEGNGSTPSGGQKKKPEASSAAESSAKKEPPAEKTQPQEKAPAAASTSEGGERIVDFVLPNLGEGVGAADVAEVLVKVGDVITAEQPVLELETEKAVMEVPCPYPGKVTEVLVKSGDKVQPEQAVLKIQTSGGPARTASSPSKTEPPQKKKDADASPEKSAPSAPPASERTSSGTALVRTTPTSDAAASGANGSQPPTPAAPSTRRLARKLGVDLAAVRGSGPGGRITQDDVQDYVRGQLAARQAPTIVRSSGGALAAGSLAPPPLPDFSRFGPVDRQGLNKIARTAAENLTVSWNVIPHVTQHDRADITDLEAARKRFGQGMGKNGPKVTMTAVAIKALATCLQAFPKFNSSLDPETNELVLKRYYHIGCAVDTPTGLLVPVVKDCDQKSILDIAARITELAEKARDRKLSMDDMQGATCTVTNLGGIGGVAFTPIVNYPEVCILGMARSQNELQLVNGEIKERLMLPLALSYDHRVINGADAARFVATLCQMLSDPFQLLSAI